MIRLFALLPAAVMAILWMRPTDPLRVAVAANFSAVADSLAQEFTALSGREVVIVSGATGLLYAQIVHGAPFDILLAADTIRPAALEQHGHGVRGSRKSYAFGRLALWSVTSSVADSGVLFDPSTRHVAIAKPETAPYGTAAREVLERLGVWNTLGAKLVRGENISQAYQLVASGSVTAGLVARSALRNEPASSYWVAPAHLHAPIQQQAIQLSRSAADPDAGAFMEFLGSPRGREIITAFGYDVADR